MNTGAGNFPYCVQSIQRCISPHIHKHPTTKIMGSGDNGDGLPSDIQVMCQTGGVNLGEPLPNIIGWFAGGDVQADIGVIIFEHLPIDGSGDDIAGS